MLPPSVRPCLPARSIPPPSFDASLAWRERRWPPPLGAQRKRERRAATAEEEAEVDSGNDREGILPRRLEMMRGAWDALALRAGLGPLGSVCVCFGEVAVVAAVAAGTRVMLAMAVTVEEW